jgi:hypothetical protein
VSFAYAQARIQARHGERPDEAAWDRLHASTTLSHFLEGARRTGLRRWLSAIGDRTEPAAIETVLHRDFRRYVVEVASWVPERWHDAVLRLPELLYAGEPVDWPRVSRAERHALEAFARELALHVQRMATPGMVDDGFAERAILGVTLTRLFRRHGEEPVAPFCHLVLVAMDLERLRGALERRALLPDVQSEVAWV